MNEFNFISYSFNNFKTCPSKIQDDRHIANLSLLKKIKISFHDISVFVAMFLAI